MFGRQEFTAYDRQVVEKLMAKDPAFSGMTLLGGHWGTSLDGDRYLWVNLRDEFWRTSGAMYDPRTKTLTKTE